MTSSSISDSIIILGQFIKTSTSSFLSTCKKNQRIELIKDNCIAYLEHGTVSVYSQNDSMLTVTIDAPFILGLTHIHNEMKHHYLRCESKCKIWIINSHVADEIFSREKIWDHAFNILTYNTTNYFRRELLTNQPNARATVNEYLKYIWSMPTEQRNRTSIYTFILARNHISRSMIHRCLQDLSKTHNIIIKKGKLIQYQHNKDP
jgi:hypothetical protein